MNTASFEIGIDENGLGPRLGPMTVTAAALTLEGAVATDRTAYLRASEAAGIGDSKAACAHGSMRVVEGRVLALLETHLGVRPASLTELHALLGLEAEPSLRRDCPRKGAASRACFEDPITLPAFGPGPTKNDHTAALALRDAGISLRAVRVAVLCARRIRVGKEQGRSRFDLDLDAMVSLTQSLRGLGPDDRARVLCGKVGGRKRYGDALAPLSALVTALEETNGRSSYRLAGMGEMHFVMDGDATEPAIGLASLVGKYARELWMHRINRFWANEVPGTQAASGYHDPVTERFVRATELARKALDVPEECFER